MKFVHMSDLHLGKRLFERSLLEEDQPFILKQVCAILRDEKPDAVLIAGDIYDKSAPSAESVRLFDDFLSQLAADGQTVFVISGNHDSSARVAYGGRIMARSGVHVSVSSYEGEVHPVTLTDAHGAVDIYLLPFIKPAHVAAAFPEKNIENYTDALRVAIENMKVDTSRRNVLVAHQFVTGATRSDSEDISVGGLDNVDVSVFAPFSYVALGHLHRPQDVGSSRIRYSGTPLPYSFSEAKEEKSLTIAELDGAGCVAVRTRPLTPLRRLRALRGSYAELTLRENYAGTATEDYLSVTLTDEEDVPDAMRKLKTIYPNVLRIEYDNARMRARTKIDGATAAETRTPLELLEEFFAMQNNRPMSEEQREYAKARVRAIWEGES